MSETEQYQDEPPQVAQRVFGSDIIDALAKNSSMVFRAVGKVESVSVDAKTLEFSTVDGKVRLYLFYLYSFMLISLPYDLALKIVFVF
jgi:hypothetical protein